MRKKFMPTQTNENYLKALYYLHQKNSAISITDLGKEMEVSKPTVNDMVKKMQAKGWVKYEKYKPLQLTKQGLREATFIIRKHRLSEMFLSQVMGFGWEEVHDMAEEMEHLKSEMFFDRMDEILGFPTKDPHGSPIPDKNGNFVKPDYRLLSQVEIGKKVVLRALRESSTEFINFLNNKEIKLGTTMTIKQIEPFDKSMTVCYTTHTDVILSHTVCNGLLVEQLT
ncbi:metal-dependent transcriptional regulator [Fulvivirgaceae bacterium BMA10]|uniref:Transcriptional regulator MntR n=1 Tax=Splendidivirga corallicola TaxID=3051826 RepID=A0ABT8KT38_9BACT|nr:metal-dependent transcriptional regulator [Fulvivirgaceae bacterium BMA10]